MITERTWMTINVSLGFIAFLLLLTLLGVELPTLGQAQYLIDSDDPICIVNFNDEFNQWDNLDRCCLEARKQSLCLKENINLQEGRVDWSCSSGGGSYLLNNKAYHYCQQQRFW